MLKYTKYKNNNATLNFQIMATKSIDKKKTLEYAVAFYFYVDRKSVVFGYIFGYIFKMPM